MMSFLQKLLPVEAMGIVVGVVGVMDPVRLVVQRGDVRRVVH